MRTVPVLGLFGALAACGGSSDNTGGNLAATYAGLWTGTLTSTVTTCPTVTADILTYTATAKAAYGSMALGPPILER